MVRHNKDGAFGITINRPIGERSLASLLDDAGREGTPKPRAMCKSLRAVPSNPVPLSSFIPPTTIAPRPSLPTDAWPSPRAGRFFATSAAKGVRRRFLSPSVTLAGRPVSFEAELARNDWFIAPADPKLIFDESRDRVWEEAMARRPRDL